jgi:pimeloyl-ACP methyl ester carboxylesterase
VIEMQERAFRLESESGAEGEVPESVDLGAVRAPERLAREIPDARHAVIPGPGHLPALERPDATSRLIRDFLHI